MLVLSACRSDPPSTPAGEFTIATSGFVALTQKALTYQADFELEAWGQLLAADVEYHLPRQGRPVLLRGKAAVLDYWKNWRERQQVRRVILSGFSIIPLHSPRKLPLTNLPGVYVATVFSRRVIYGSNQKVEQPVCLWVHFNEKKLIDRLYSFQPDDPQGYP